MRALYRFGMEYDAAAPFTDIWDKAFFNAHSQGYFEEQCGGGPWPEWELILVRFEPNTNDHEKYIYMFEVQVKTHR